MSANNRNRAPQYNLRIEDEFRTYLKGEGHRNNRSLNQEIIARLELTRLMDQHPGSLTGAGDTDALAGGILDRVFSLLGAGPYKLSVSEESVYKQLEAANFLLQAMPNIQWLTLARVSSQEQRSPYQIMMLESPGRIVLLRLQLVRDPDVEVLLGRFSTGQVVELVYQGDLWLMEAEQLVTEMWRLRALGF